ncbi:Uncharacterised protein [uncultured archaeon]|nr:Uncharacterised protein [uncultured archaeon]
MQSERVPVSVSRQSIESLLKNGKQHFLFKNPDPLGVTLFATLGNAYSNFAKANQRGKMIEGQIQTLKRTPPTYGIIVKHHVTPFHLPRFFQGYKTKQGRITTFDFLPKPTHAVKVAQYDTLVQTIAGSLGHLALIEDGSGNAYLAQLQGNVSRHNLAGTKNLLHEYDRMYANKLNRAYSSSFMALFLAARNYCNERRLTLHLFHPKVYVGITALKVPHLIEGNEAEIENLYGTTRGLAKRLFKKAKTQEIPLPSKHWRAFVMSEIKDTLVFSPLSIKRKRRH